jgi:hypothetical protein
MPPSPRRSPYLLGRLARLGFLADMLSRPVRVGYLTGIALDHDRRPA